MNYVNQTINEIRQKYVGTCYEHDLLRSLASEADSMHKRIKEDLQRDLESELGNREYHRAIYTAVTEGMSLDREIRQWKDQSTQTFVVSWVGFRRNGNATRQPPLVSHDNANVYRARAGRF